MDAVSGFVEESSESLFHGLAEPSDTAASDVRFPRFGSPVTQNKARAFNTT
jgi:hypothetical protein